MALKQLALIISGFSRRRPPGLPDCPGFHGRSDDFLNRLERLLPETFDLFPRSESGGSRSTSAMWPVLGPASFMLTLRYVHATAAGIETEAAPIRYVAELVGADTDSERAIRWMIALMVCAAIRLRSP